MVYDVQALSVTARSNDWTQCGIGHTLLIAFLMLVFAECPCSTLILAVYDPRGILDLLSRYRTAQHCGQLSPLCTHVSAAQHHDPPGTAALCHTSCARWVGQSCKLSKLVPGDVIVIMRGRACAL